MYRKIANAINNYKIKKHSMGIYITQRSHDGLNICQRVKNTKKKLLKNTKILKRSKKEN